MANGSSSAADVLIIGGGIIGCSIAWRLAQAGSRVTVVDRSAPGEEASSAAAGMLAPLGEMLEPQAFLDLCVASRDLYPQFVAEIEESSSQPVGFRRDGTLLVALAEEPERELAQIYRTRSAQGFALQPLGAAELHARESWLAPGIRSGLFVPGDHWVDNERLMRALVAACRRAGVQFAAGNAVRAFQESGGHIESVTTADGTRHAAGTFVLSAGCWSGELARELGLHLPIAPCHGQMMEFETPRDLPFVVRAGIHYLVPRGERRLLVGTTAEYNGWEKAVTAQGLLSILEGGTELTSLLGGSRFLRAWAGLRPDTADHLPALGYGELDNLVFATGHFRNGILLAPVTAEIVAGLILQGTAPHSIVAYSPVRFTTGGEGPNALPLSPRLPGEEGQGH